MKILLVCLMISYVVALNIADTPVPSTTFKDFVATYKAIPTNQFAVKTFKDAGKVATELGMKNLGEVEGVRGWYTFEIPESLATIHEQKGLLEKHMEKLRQHGGVEDWTHLELKRFAKKKSFTDPLFGDQWHLKNTGQNGATSGQDAGLNAAWDAGYSGKDVLIQIVDDGVEHGHTDFAGKYVAAASFDFNGKDSNPTPNDPSSSHGTSCAGVALAKENNSKCGVGAAYGAKLGAIRLIDAAFTDVDAANAMTKYSVGKGVHISSNSWGSADTGVSFDKTSALFDDARKTAATDGRNGRGIVITWASGNGNLDGDNCNYDMYSTSPYIISVAASNAAGKWSEYSELCSANLVNAPSSDAGSTLPGITTTTTNNGCVNDFGGTSSATPLVSGVVALIFEANPALTYRDVMYVLIQSATINDALDSSWETNGANLKFSEKYGFGRVNAGQAVTVAKNFNRVNQLSIEKTKSTTANKAIVSLGSVVEHSIDISSSEIVSLEHVNVYLNIQHNFANELDITLVSPEGTESRLALTHNAGPLPVIDNFFLGGYTSFSPQIPAQGLSVTQWQIGVPSANCNSFTYGQNTVNMNQKLALILYLDTSCDAGALVSLAQQQGAIAAGFMTDFQSISGQSGSTIPSFKIPIELAFFFFDHASSTGLTVTQPVPIQHKKYPMDTDLEGNFRMMTVKCWGESPKGTWTLKVKDNTALDDGTLVDWTIELFGANDQEPTESDPSASTVIGGWGFLAALVFVFFARN